MKLRSPLAIDRKSHQQILSALVNLFLLAATPPLSCHARFRRAVSLRLEFANTTALWQSIHQKHAP
jgi:hypothetical protein